MCNINKTLIFIEKAQKVHGNTYNYNKVIYNKAKIDVEIICKTHGSFLQPPNRHLNGAGCPKCGIAQRAKLIKNDLNKFIQKANKIHGFKYDYSKSNYTNSKTKIYIICKNHGGFWQQPSNHLQKQGCPKCGKNITLLAKKKTTEKFINEAIKLHGNKYDYSKVNYVNSNKNKIEIICPLHGNFWQTPSQHLNGGCKKCSIINIANTRINKAKQNFTILAKQLHNDAYNYDLVDYKKAKQKVKIICFKHGIFEQTPDSHLRGSGCNLCGNEKQSLFQKQNPVGWYYEEWEEKAKKSKYFDSFKVYIIECWNENERFFKIGRTFRTVYNRFFHKSILPYHFNILKQITGTAEEICELELKLKKLNKNNKYLPKLHFFGKYECYKQIIIENEKYI